jgi:DNA polymerase-4
MDAFFVSVEELFDPSLKGKPVVVGGNRDQRGVVSAASYAARKFGVHSAMPLRTAARICPQAIFVPGHMDRYRDYSHKIFEILNRFTPQVELASVDEAYLDLTGTARLHGPPLEAAHRLHETVKWETNLNCSLGLSTSRLVAKVCSDQAKPNGVIWVVPGAEAAFLAPLDVRKIPGVGKVAEQSLHALGIRKVGDLGRLDEHFLAERFGKWGLALSGKARGADAGAWFDGEIGEHSQPKSISHETTFSEDVGDRARLEAALLKLSEMVAGRLRDHRLYARTLQLKLRNHDFETITRAESLGHATQLDREISACVTRLFRKAWDGKTLIRLIGVHAGSLEESEGQMSLLEEPQTARLREAFRAVDHLRDKYGDQVIGLAKGMSAGIRERVHENAPGIPGKAPGHPSAPPPSGTPHNSPAARAGGKKVPSEPDPDFE